VVVIITGLATSGCASSYWTLASEAAPRLGCARSELKIRKLNEASDEGAETACVHGCGVAGRYMVSCISRTGLGGCNWVLIEKWKLKQGSAPSDSCFPRAAAPAPAP